MKNESRFCQSLLYCIFTGYYSSYNVQSDMVCWRMPATILAHSSFHQKKSQMQDKQLLSFTFDEHAQKIHNQGIY